MSFHVGQKVVCVDVQNNPGRVWQGDAPVVGDVYTVTAVFIDFEGSPAVKLAEISRSPKAFRKFDGKLFGYKARRFRPLIENKSSVSFTMGADPESESWDNRVKIPEKTVSHHH